MGTEPEKVLAEALRWLVDHSVPTHGDWCFLLEPDEACVCGVSDRYEAILALAILAPAPGAAGEPNDDEPGGFVMAGAAGEVEDAWEALEADIHPYSGNDLIRFAIARHRPHIEAALRGDTAPALDTSMWLEVHRSHAPDDEAVHRRVCLRGPVHD